MNEVRLAASNSAGRGAVREAAVYPLSDRFFLLDANGQAYLASSETLEIYGIDQSTRARLIDLSSTGSPEQLEAALARLLGSKIDSRREIAGRLGGFARAYYGDTRDIRFLTLDIAHRCNLRCDYCYASHGEYRGKSVGQELMKSEVALRAVDSVLSKSAGTAGKRFVDFFGGEPLLNFSVLQDVVQHVERHQPASTSPVVFSVNTNGIPITPRIATFLAEHDVAIHVSVDGDRRLHDTHRRFPDGRGSFETIARNLERCRKLKPELLSARATVTPQTIDFSTVFRTFNELGFGDFGFDIAFGDGSDPSTAWNDDSMNAFDTSFGEYMRQVADSLLRSESLRLPSFLFDALYRLHHGKLHVITCRMAAYLLVAAPLGQYYPCYKLTEESQYEIGNVYRGVDEERRRALYPELVFENAYCSHCWARFLCGGGCPASSYLAGSVDHAPDKWVCRSRKIQWKWYLWLYVTLRRADYRISRLFPSTGGSAR